METLSKVREEGGGGLTAQVNPKTSCECERIAAKCGLGTWEKSDHSEVYSSEMSRSQ